MTMRVAEYIARTLVEHEVRDAFLVTGGGAMFLNDALGHCPGLRCWPCHHEQACAIAAESYFRVTRRMAAVNVTSGPGGTNAITGVYGAYVDSIPMVVVSGQVKWETTVRATGLALRQLGDQEIDITHLVAPVTKYAVMVSDPLTIRYHLERALYLATQGRPGPVWLDVPINVQGAEIDPESLQAYEPGEDSARVPPMELAVQGAEAVVAALRSSSRPVIVAGCGVWTSGAAEGFRQLVECLGIPTVTAFNAHDLLPSSHPCLVGRQGTIGDRAGNVAVQNADFLLILGARMNIRQISYAWESFAPRARIAMVDIDALEFRKPTLRVDLPVHGDVAVFVRAMLERVSSWEAVPAHLEYLAWCQERRARYLVVLEEYWNRESPVNPYCFMDALFRCLEAGDVVVTGDGTACIASFQAAIIKPGCVSSPIPEVLPWGTIFPAAVGAAIGSGARRVICLAGDGSIMMNLQELQTISHHGLPVKVFLMNNAGYHSIRQTQRNFFPGREFGSGPTSGVGFPDFGLVAQAHGFSYRKLESHGPMEQCISECIALQGPVLCEVILDQDQPFAPRVASRRLEDGRLVSAPLENMAPFLEADEVRENRRYLAELRED